MCRRGAAGTTQLQRLCRARTRGRRAITLTEGDERYVVSRRGAVTALLMSESFGRPTLKQCRLFLWLRARRHFLSRRFFPQREDGAAALTPVPLSLGLDERSARAYACDAATLECLLVAGVEARPVVFEREREVARVVEVNAEADARGLGVAADVADGLLHDAVDLHLHAGRKRESLVEIFIAVE